MISNPRMILIPVVVLLMIILAGLSCPPARAATLTVTNTNDSGAGSLRQAIIDANNTDPADVIKFNIPGAGVHTINLTSPLPAITEPLTIDGYSQPGSSVNTLATGDNAVLLIELNGAGITGSGVGLDIAFAFATVRGLVLNRFPNQAIVIRSSAANVIISGCFIGTDPGGTIARPNTAGGITINQSPNNTVGGLTPDARNVISGNFSSASATTGVVISGDPSNPSGTSGNVVLGNYIGVNSSGKTALANDDGVEVSFASGVTIGGSSAAARNVISGNASNGIELTNVSNSSVEGNYIGVDVNGTAKLPNQFDGILLSAHCASVTVGGTAASQGNLISGNQQNGIELYPTADNNVVENNLIGTDKTGNSALGNNASGIDLSGSSNQIGAPGSPWPRNVISGNFTGILITGNYNSILGNFIGTNVSGKSAVPNTTYGIDVNGALATVIGSVGLSNGNVISGNLQAGIHLQSSNGNVIENNGIGIDLNGLPLGNGQEGILIETTSDSFIGSTAGPAHGNTIAFNRRGVVIFGLLRNQIVNNFIFSNEGPPGKQWLGIDLGGDGVTANDPGDGDSGQNTLLNFPDLSSAIFSAGTTHVTGTYNSAANGEYLLFFYANSSCDPSGYGEGERPVGQLVVDTDASGNASFSTNVNVPAGEFLTATAIDGSGNTSEFSQCRLVTGPPPATFQFSGVNYLMSENGGSVQITVNRTGDTAGSNTVEFATSDTAGSQKCSVTNGAASSRCDYDTTLRTLHFAPGDTAKTVMVPIIDDSLAEGNETFNVTLSNPIGGVLGAASTATVTILDNDSVTGVNPVDQAGFFVRQHYVDFLSREPDGAGFSFWDNILIACGTSQSCIQDKRTSVSASFYLSIEFQQNGFFVERVYKAAFGDASAASTLGGAHQVTVPVIRLNEFLHDTQGIGDGVVVNQGSWQTQIEANKQLFLQEFMQRPKFSAAYPTNLTPAQFVDKLNANAGNPLSQAERDQLVNELTTHAKTAPEVLRAVAEDPDLVTAEFNRAFVLFEYFGYLRRNPDDFQDSDYTGFDFWLTKLNQAKGNYLDAEMMKAFLSSTEYRQRFGP